MKTFGTDAPCTDPNCFDCGGPGRFSFDESLISDLHKDAYGFRPNSQYWTDWSFMTAAEKQQEWDHLLERAREEDDRRESQELRSYELWSADIRALMTEHNISEARAIIWDMQSYVSGIDDLSMYCYKRGLTFSTEMEIDKLLAGVR